MAEVVYRNLNKTRTFKVEQVCWGKYAVIEYRKGKAPRTMATYGSRAEAETELAIFASDGFRRVIE